MTVAALLAILCSACAESSDTAIAADATASTAITAVAAAAGEVAAGDGEPGAQSPSTRGIAEIVASQRLVQWTLPKQLREISGLTLTADGRLLALADERALIHELDYRAGKRVKRFGVGDPILAGDFEGIATHEAQFYAITSDGVLVRFAEGGDGERIPYTRFDTGLADVCEVEGLAWAGALDALLIACKRVYGKTGKGQVWLFRWSVSLERLEPPEPMVIAESVLANAIGDDSFHPSGISVDPADGTLWLIAARERAIARLGLAGDDRLVLLDAARFPAADRHRQAEGIAVLANGSVLIGDEGGKNNKGRLGIYGEP